MWSPAHRGPGSPRAIHRAVRGIRVALAVVIGVAVLAGVTWIGANLLTGQTPAEPISRARARASARGDRTICPTAPLSG